MCRMFFVVLQCYGECISTAGKLKNLPGHGGNRTRYLWFSRLELVRSSVDDFRFRKNFNLGKTKDISGKKLSKLEKLQSLVAKC